MRTGGLGHPRRALEKYLIGLLTCVFIVPVAVGTSATGAREVLPAAPVVQARTAAFVGGAQAAASPMPEAVPLPGSAGAADSGAMDAVILVDVSRSLDEPTIALEARAAGVIAATDLSTRTRIAVTAFASMGPSGSSTARPAAETLCPLAPVDDPDDRDRISGCLSGIMRRTAGQGQDTDYVAALKSGFDTLLSAPATGFGPARKVIFILTDGQLSTAGTDSSGGSSTDRSESGQIRDEILPAARKAGIEIWPFGFGPKPNITDPTGHTVDLATLARDASPPPTPCPGYDPATERVVPLATSADLTGPLLTTLGLLRCEFAGPVKSYGLDLGSEVGVVIPAGVADAAITVLKPSQGTRLTFHPPGPGGVGDKDVPLPRDFDDAGSSYVRRGGSGWVESLRIVNPPPGTWVVKAEPAPGEPGGMITVVPVWRLLGNLEIDGPAPYPGSQASAHLRLFGRRDAFADAAGTAGLRVDVTTLRPGQNPADGIPAGILRDDGGKQDVPGAERGGGAGNGVGSGTESGRGDGVFSGSVAVPKDASERVIFVARLGGTSFGQALCARQVCGEWTFMSAVSGSAGGVGAAGPHIRIRPPAGSVVAGGEISGEITIHALGTGKLPLLGIALLDQDPGVTVSPARIQPPPAGGGSGTGTTVRFTLRVDSSARPGPLRGSVAVTNLNAPPNMGMAIGDFDITVRPAPTGGTSGWVRLIVALVSAALFAALVSGGLMAWGSSKKRRSMGGRPDRGVADPSDIPSDQPVPSGTPPSHEPRGVLGLTVYLYDHGTPVDYLDAEESDGARLALRLPKPDSPPQLARPADGAEPDFVIRRVEDPESTDIRIRRPGQRELTFPVGLTVLHRAENAFDLAVMDTWEPAEPDVNPADRVNADGYAVSGDGAPSAAVQPTAQAVEPGTGPAPAVDGEPDPATEPVAPPPGGSRVGEVNRA